MTSLTRYGSPSVFNPSRAAQVGPVRWRNLPLNGA
jgi:hypothetical protein